MWECSPPMGWRSGSECPPQPGLVDPPEVVLVAVDQRHRDLLGVARGQRRIRVHVELLPRLPEVGADPGDDLAGHLAQVAAGPRDERDAGGHEVGVSPSSSRVRRRSAARSRPFWTLPVTVYGNSVTTWMALGRLNRARRSSQCAATASRTRSGSPSETTYATTASPVRSSATPMTAAALTPSTSATTSSTSTG